MLCRVSYDNSGVLPGLGQKVCSVNRFSYQVFIWVLLLFFHLCRCLKIVADYTLNTCWGWIVLIVTCTKYFHHKQLLRRGSSS
jgi:hypothetical protein